MATWTEATKNSASWTEGTKNTVTWSSPSEAGGSWEYNQLAVTYENSGYYYNGFGVTTSWTNATKN